MTAGNHTFKHTIPTAVFNQEQGDVYLSVYMQGKTSTNLNVKDVKTVDVSIYPNPTSDFINIKSPIDVASIEVFGIDGRKLSETYKENRYFILQRRNVHFKYYTERRNHFQT